MKRVYYSFVVFISTLLIFGSSLSNPSIRPRTTSLRGDLLSSATLKLDLKSIKDCLGGDCSKPLIDDLSSLFASKAIGRPVLGSTGRHLTSSLDLSNKVHEIRSHLGDFKLKVIGNTSSDHVPIIALPGAKLKLFDEWTFIAEYLSKHGFVVYVLYVYGWKNQSRAAALIYESLFKKTDGQGDLVGVSRAGIATPLSSAIVMGKSAGGSLAQSFARAYPKEISKLCLICPVASGVDVIRELSGRDLKLFLAWAEDDPIAPFTKSGLWKSNYKESLLSFTSAKRGGHAILDEYAVPLLRFLKS